MQKNISLIGDADEWLEEFALANSQWVAELSNGEVAVQDDGRPGRSPESGWLRLRDYVRENGLRVVNLHLRFRHRVAGSVPPNCEAVYFARKASFTMGDAGTTHQAAIGFVQGGKLFVEVWEVPALVLSYREERPVPAEGESLLVNGVNHAV
jgi:hypothetical protein